MDPLSDAPLAIRDQIQAISEEWVSDKALPEMGFTLGGLDELDDPAVRCLIAIDARPHHSRHHQLDAVLSRTASRSDGPWISCVAAARDSRASWSS